MVETVETTCCIAGGGPAGMVLGLLLARAGIDVLVLEKHADFLRDFRGDTIHPSTLQAMHELGLLDDLLKLPHQETDHITGIVGGRSFTVADFSHLPQHCRFLAIMPQWDFLDFLSRRAARYPGFRLRMRTAATSLIEEGGRIVGVHAEGPDGALEIRCRLVVGADGRHSTIRTAAGLKVETLGASMDVLWFALSRRPGDPEETTGRFEAGVIFVMINRGDHWQCGYVIAKGALDALRREGLPAFRERIGAMMPFARDRLGEIADWESVKLLTVAVDRLARWHRPGLLCIGDAAHAMSPVGGVGINLAIQDAIATANLLAAPLRAGTLTEGDLARVQARRTLPTRLTQRLQLLVQNRVISRVLSHANETRMRPPAVLTLFDRFPWLRRIPARLIGVGFRPEHVRTPEVRTPA